MRILADSTLPNIMDLFKPPFSLTLYQNHEQLSLLLAEHDILICRSTLKVSAKLLEKTSIQCVATASSGIDHIDAEYLKANRIALIDAKGSNARSVADYVISTLAYLQKSNLLEGNMAGVVGIGEVGKNVVTRLLAADFNVVCFDPPKASLDPNFISCDFNDLLKCDLLCLHPNLNATGQYKSKNLINEDVLKLLKSRVVILNAARGGIVNEKDLLETNKPITYCTDVYCNEPDISNDLIDFATICTPHIAGHSIEAKQLAVVQVRNAIYNRYNIDIPKSSVVDQTLIKTSILSCWQENALNLYNPIADTIELKKSSKIKQAFLTQRNSHITRHDYNRYDWSLADDKTRKLLL